MSLIAEIEDAIPNSWRIAHQVDTQDETAGWWATLRFWDTLCSPALEA